MFDASLNQLILFLQNLLPEVGLLNLFLVCVVLIFAMMRLFGSAGLFAFMCLAVVAGNIQVLKLSHFSYQSEAVALGTVLFSTTFLCVDILAEYYGRASAKKAVWLSFSAMLIMMILMVLTLGFKPLATTDQQNVQSAMETLFLPIPSLFVASLIAYFVSQMNDVWLFLTLSKLTLGRMLWLRAVFSTAISAFLDNVIFSVLAWIVLAKTPLDWDTVFYSYILGTYPQRLIIAVLGVPMIYAARYFRKREAL